MNTTEELITKHVEIRKQISESLRKLRGLGEELSGNSTRLKWEVQGNLYRAASTGDKDLLNVSLRLLEQTTEDSYIYNEIRNISRLL